MSDNEKLVKKEDQEKKAYLIVVLVAVLFLIPIAIFLLRNPGVEENTDQTSEKDNLEMLDTVEDTKDEVENDEKKKVEFTINEEKTEDEEELVEEAEPLYSNLIISDYTLPENVTEDEEFELQFEIENNGDVKAEDFLFEWKPDGDDVACDEEIESLEPGETTVIECSYEFDEAGTYESEAEIDENDDVEESNEDDNTLEFDIKVNEPEKADIIITEYSFDPVPAKNVPFTVRIGIKNQGSVATGSFNWEWWPTWAIDACSEEISELAPNSTKVVTCDYEYQGCSTYATKAVVDVDGEVDELEEDNNEYEEELVVPCF